MTAAAVASIPEREADFHDDWAATEDPAGVLVEESFAACTCPENRAVARWLGDVRGLKILELGCGCGEASVYFAKRGAAVTATDVSPGMLQLTERVAAHHGTRVETRVASSDELPFADASFDVVYGANVLHHSDLPRAVAEAHRVLKPGGRACFWDPVAYNPVINVYRRMATKVRTEDEHPLRKADLDVIRSRFSRVETDFFWLLTLAHFLRFYLIDRVHPNQERYWKKVIREAGRLKRAHAILESADAVLLRAVPPLRWWCWNVVVRATK